MESLLSILLVESFLYHNKIFTWKSDTFITVCIFICYSIYVLLILISRITTYNKYKKLIKVFYYFQALYNERYKLYLTGGRVKIEDHSNKIKIYGNAILEVSNYIVLKNVLSKNHIQHLKIQMQLHQYKLHIYHLNNLLHNIYFYI